MKIIPDTEAKELLESLTTENIKDWLLDPVTQIFFACIQALKEDNQNFIFTALEKNNMREAADYSAARSEDMSILELPDDLIADIIKVAEIKRLEKENV